MGDLGIRVAQKGFSADTCADEQLLFSSAWPTLKTHAAASFTIPDATQDVTIFTHSLGYPPVFMVFTTGTYVNSSPGSSLAVGSANAESFVVDINTLKYLGATNGNPPGSITGYYYIFRQKMTDTVLPRSFNTARGVPAVSNDIGFKIAKAGKSTSSTDFRDFVIHSSARSPQIHMTGQVTIPGGGTVLIHHGLGYPPLYLLYNVLSGLYHMSSNSQEVIVGADTSNITLSGVPGLVFYYLVFKDPFNNA